MKIILDSSKLKITVVFSLPFFLPLPIFPRTQYCLVCLHWSSDDVHVPVIRRKPCGSPCMCLLLANRLWFFVHSENSLLFLPLPRSKPPQIIGNILSIANSFWIRHSGSYSAAALPWGERGLCKANIWWPYPWNHKLNPTWCRRCNYPNKTGWFSPAPQLVFAQKKFLVF